MVVKCSLICVLHWENTEIRHRYPADFSIMEEKDDIYLIPDGSIGEEKLDSELRRKLSYIDAAVEELASI